LVIGCGYTSQRDKCLTDKVVATDIDRGKISVAKKGDPKAYFVVCDALSLPFKANVFEDVICTDVLEHLREYKKAILEIINLNPNKIYLRFPTKEREALLARVSQVYRTQHLGKIHVTIVDPHWIVEILEKRSYDVKIEVTDASSTLARCFLHSILEKFKIEYQIPEIGFINFFAKKKYYYILIYASAFFGKIFGYLPYLLWKVLKIKTVHRP
jgi:hypothetical protein